MFVSTFGIGVASIYGLILVSDPYDTGRFGIGFAPGVLDENPRTAHASRGRDQRFDSAVIGNSQGQLLDPSRLSAETGRRFVQLTIPGARPREQLTVLRWFSSRHARIGAVVLVADPTWCTEDASLPTPVPFPFWLYGESLAEYATHMLHTAALERIRRRILVTLGLRQPSEATGYWDYEEGRAWSFSPVVPANLQPATEMREPQRRFPAIEALSAFLNVWQARLIVVLPPVFVTVLPLAGSEPAQAMGECKSALAKVVDGYGELLDFAVDGDIARDPTNFMDGLHYRAGVARHIEKRIAAALPGRP